MRKSGLPVSVFLFIALLFLLLCPPAYAETDGAADKIIIIMIDNLMLGDLEAHNTPGLLGLTETGAIGLLNLNSAGEKNNKNILCTISAGHPAVSSTNAHINHMALEAVEGHLARDYFYLNTGLTTGRESILIQSIHVIRKNNDRRNSGIPGSLGEALAAQNVSGAVIGNSDRPGYPNRLGPLLLMNNQGIIPGGNIGGEMLDERSFFTNYTLLFEEVHKFRDTPMLLIEYGDLNRLDSMYSFLSPIQYRQERENILAQIDRSVQQVLDHAATDRTHILVIAPSPSRPAQLMQKWLTPVIMVKPGFEGVLSSPDTRREGLVNASTIHSSLLYSAGINAAETIVSSPKAEPVPFLRDLTDREAFIHTHRVYILQCFIAVLALLVLAICYFYLVKKKNLPLELLGLYTLALPGSMLLITLWDIGDRIMYIGVMFFIAALISLGTYGLARLLQVSSWLLLAFFTILAITVNFLGNWHMIENAVMSYRIYSANRFYGLGNEYLGILLGSSILFAFLVFSSGITRLRKLLVATVFVLVVFIISHPSLGINVGGTIVSLVALSYMYILFTRDTIKTWDWLIWVSGTILVLGILFAIDSRLEYPSHLAVGIKAIIENGSAQALSMILNKLKLHLYVISYTSWGWFFLILLAAALYSFIKPSPRISAFKALSPFTYRGLQVIILAAVLAFIFNDSGFVTAVILTTYSLFLFTAPRSPVDEKATIRQCHE